MKKNNLNSYNEINFIEITRTILNDKLKIILITIVTISIGLFHYYATPNSFKNSIVIKPNKNSEFVRLESLFKFFESEELEEKQGTEIIKVKINKVILERYLRELMDYEELIAILSNNEKIKKQISEFSESDKKQKLFNYSRNLTIVDPIKKNSNHVLNFVWYDNNEAKDILEQTLKLALINLENSIFKELEDRLEIKKNQFANEDLLKIDYLLEQSSIAKELEIYDNQIDSGNLPQSNISFNRNTNEIAYYLRGYKAIDKEISLIQRRTYKNLDYVKNEIIALREMNSKLVDYNTFLMVSKSSKSFTKSLVISILLGLLLGSCYVLVTSALKSKK